MRSLRHVLSCLVVLAALGCAPSRPPVQNQVFVLTFKNDGPFAQDVTVTYWWADPVTGGWLSDQLPAEKVPTHETREFKLWRAYPELVDVQAGWGHVSWSRSDYGGWCVGLVSYPGATLSVSQRVTGGVW